MRLNPASFAVGLLVAVMIAGCGGDDGQGVSEQGTTTTVVAPLRPELQLAATGGVGRVEEWIETWNLVNAALEAQLTDFPTIALDIDGVTVRGASAGFPVFTAQIDQLILGGVVAADDGGITALLLTGQPTDPLFVAAFSIWLGAIDPTVDPLELLPFDVAFGDEAASTVESNARTFQAVKVANDSGAVITVTMVAGPEVDPAFTASAHQVVRSEVLSVLAAETSESDS